jgi:hypothetical protein
MKLQIVPAKQGARWVKLGMVTFFKQPLALSGLFFMFLAAMSLLNMVPLIGTALALMLLPGATLGLMAATRETTLGKFPMPSILISAFRAGRQQMRAMMTLGGMYAVGFLLVLAASAAIDGGSFAKLYLMGGSVTPELVQEPGFQSAALTAIALYIPLSLMFWHAPALVHWHGISPGKSLFFSLVACWRNFLTFTVYSLVWMAVFVGTGLVAATIAGMVGGAALATTLLFPVAMLMASMFFVSMYFTFRDCFEATLGEPQ